jgi:MFS-type transporter involved in bile tolerance (Atg22 family)
MEGHRGDGQATPTGWLPAETQVRQFLVVSFIDSLGTGLFLAGSALFFTRDLGLSAGQVGLGLSLAGVTGFLCAVPVGRISDRTGALPVLVVLQLWRAACFFAYPFAKSLELFIVVSCMAGAGEWAAGPVVQSLLGSLVPEASRVRTMSALTMVRNVGFGVGAGGAAAVVAVSGAVYRGLVVADAASFLFSAVLLARMRAAERPSAKSRSRAPGPRVRPGARYLTLAALNGVLYLHTVVLSVGLPLWIATRTHGPRALIGVIVIANTILAAAGQLRLSRGVDGAGPAASRQFRAGCVLAACCLLVAVTGPGHPGMTVALILAATVALTVGEIYQSVGGWGVSYGFAPEQSRGYYVSVYSLGSTCAAIVGPLLLTSAVLPAGGPGWIALAGLFAVSGALVPAVVRGGLRRAAGAGQDE